VNPTYLSIEVQSRKFCRDKSGGSFQTIPVSFKVVSSFLSDYVQLAGTKSLCLEVRAITSVPPALNFIKLWGQEHVKSTKGTGIFRDPK
jgi:hypothetical protein